MNRKNSRKTIPEKGIEKAALFQEMADSRRKDVKWKEGKCWSLVYYLDEEHLQLLEQAHNLYISENYINPFAFPSVQKMEKEIVDMTIDLLHGDEQVVGSLTSGGTESIFLALYTYREKSGKKHPEVVLPVSAHPAFKKAAHILGIKLRKVGVGKDFRPNPKDFQKYINSNTILLVASAPQYPHGVLDPIEEIGKLAIKNKLPFHVDSCIGGFLLPWIEKLGHTLPAWDFRVPGVTSISADAHKFAYGSKGTSVLMYRELDYLKHQFFIFTDWPGGIYASSTILGTRSAGPIAAAWAAMNSLGKEGYLRITEKILLSVDRYKEAIQSIPELKILGQPVMNIIAFSSSDKDVSILAIADHLEENGWTVDRQQFPDSIHTTIMLHNIPALDDYIRDLKEAVQYVKMHPETATSGNAAMYGMMSKIPLRGVVKKNVRKIMEDLYAPGKTRKELSDSPEQEATVSIEEKIGKKIFGFIVTFNRKLRKLFSNGNHNKEHNI
ncbi:MAG: aspartate aminotransferase family protein [Bacteroidetes bacterium]|nr:aspartate aminotransferase family protein [Bacteroidota bacterium]